jgi:GNAT superfamily N-acetyltransferase
VEAGCRQAEEVTTWDLRIDSDESAEEVIRDRLIGYNKDHSAIVRERFRPENLPSHPLAVYAYDGDELVGGACGRTVDVWRWLTVDLMWVDDVLRGRGLGRALLGRLEEEARLRGCDWSKLNTWDFQAPDFYTRCGYVEYGREVDYPPGHTNFLLRKDLR